MQPIKLTMEFCIPLMVEAFEKKRLTIFDEDLIKGNYGCVYRTDNDKCCIVGACISDTQAKDMFAEFGSRVLGTPISDLIRQKIVVCDADTDLFLNRSQRCFDMCTLNKGNERSVEVAVPKFVEGFNKILSDFDRPERISV